MTKARAEITFVDEKSNSYDTSKTQFLTSDEIAELVEYCGSKVDMDVEVLDEALVYSDDQDLVKEKEYLMAVIRPILRKLVDE